MTRTTNSYLAFAAFLLLSTAAPAGTIYDNGGPLENGGTGASDLDPFSADIYQEIADDFTLSATATINGVNWWGAYTPNNQSGAVPDDFTIRIIDNLFNLVAEINVGTVARFNTGLDNALGLDIYGYEVTFSPFALTAGQYLLSIVNNTVGDGDFERWSWQSTANITGNIGQFRRSDGVPLTGYGGWQDASSDFAFNITAVPEPGTLALLGIGLLGIGLSRRREKS